MQECKMSFWPKINITQRKLTYFVNRHKWWSFRVVPYKSRTVLYLSLKLYNPYYNNAVATCISLSSIHIFPSLRHSCSIITNVVHILWSTNQCDKNENLHWHCQRHVSHWVNYSFLCNQSTLIRDLSEFIIICLDRNLSEENLLSILSSYLLLTW